MRKLLLVAASFAAFTSCKNADEKKAEPAALTQSSEDVTYAYPIQYSAKFEMSDPKLAQKVTELWKDYDNNDFSKNKDAFADTVTMEMPGWRIKATRDSVVNSVAGYRSSMAGAVSKVDAVFTIKSPEKDKDGNWVAIWGSEIDTRKDKSVDSISLHEIWHFDKNGKVDYMSQYKQEYPKK